MSRARKLRLLLSAIASIACLLAATSATAQALEDVGGASWRLEQPAPPAPPAGVAEAPAPVGLGRIGDIEFAPGMPNRGVLIASGNPPTVPAGVWEYNGVSWHLLASVCGASNGRVIWAGPEEFWTISDGRIGQAPGPHGEQAPIRDNTLCRFSNPEHKGEPLRVMESFAAPAFEADSYQEMDAGACFAPDDCWFAGRALPSQSTLAGSFHLHWNGSTLSEEPYPVEGHAIGSMQLFEGHLFESARIRETDRSETEEAPVAVHTIAPEGTSPTFAKVGELPLYESEEFPAALDYLHLSAGEELLWGAAGPQTPPPGSKPGQVTIVREAGGGWTQVVGPTRTAETGEEPFKGETPTTIAAEPASEDAWIGLDTPEDYAAATSETPGEEPAGNDNAEVARVGANGSISSEDEQSLPGAGSGIGPKGAAYTMTCPAAHDCWLATTHGWLFHLETDQEQTEREAGSTEDHDPAFETEISERPHDLGLPVTTPDTLPPGEAGLGEAPPAPPLEVAKETKEETRITVPLLSHIHTRVLHGHTLELSFHLEVKARLRLLAKRGKKVVASTATKTLKAGNRTLSLQLNPKRWPTKLQLQSHALAPLPTESLNRSNETTVSTSLRFPNLRATHLPDLLP